MVKQMRDPMEEIIHGGLVEGQFEFQTGEDGGTTHYLDFHLSEYNVAIEVKRLHSPRISKQLERHPDVIVAQGEKAVRLLASLLANFPKGG